MAALHPNVKVEWTREAVQALLTHWKNAECLYDPRNNLYQNKHARFQALENIAVKMSEIVPGMTTSEIKTKMNYLRSQYCRELQKINDSSKSGAGTDDIYTPSAYWFVKLSFLKDFVNVRKGKSNLFIGFDESFLSEQEDSTALNPKQGVYEIFSVGLDDTTSSSSKPRKSLDDGSQSELEERRPKIKRKKMNSDESDVDNALKSATNFLSKISDLDLKKATPTNEYEDGVTTFFMLHLKEITNKDLRDEVVGKIMTLLFEYGRKQRHMNET